jgi:hypothetical protein
MADDQAGASEQYRLAARHTLSIPSSASSTPGAPA